MRRFDQDNVRHIVYNNLSEFFEDTDVARGESMEFEHSENRDLWETIHSSSRSGRKESWRYGDEESRDEYLDKRFDPKKGRDLCYSKVRDVIADTSYKKLVQQSMTYKRKVHFEDHGHKLDISKAIAGEDRYFIRSKNASKPSVKIAINICGSACVGKEQFTKLASTVIPTIYALETASIPTEVWFTALASGTMPGSVNHVATQVKLKSAEQRFNWTTFAPVFTLGSYRESMFLSWIYDPQYECCGGLGRPMDGSTIEEYKNFGYTAVIGFNAPGPVETVQEVFKKLYKS